MGATCMHIRLPNVVEGCQILACEDAPLGAPTTGARRDWSAVQGALPGERCQHAGEGEQAFGRVVRRDSNRSRSVLVAAAHSAWARGPDVVPEEYQYYSTGSPPATMSV